MKYIAESLNKISEDVLQPGPVRLEELSSPIVSQVMQAASTPSTVMPRVFAYGEAICGAKNTNKINTFRDERTRRTVTMRYSYTMQFVICRICVG